MSAWLDLALPILPAAYATYVWRLGTVLGRPDPVLESPPREARHPAGPQEDAPGFTVLIAARNEEEQVAATLAAVAEQTLPRDRWEVLVVDDGSRDDTARVARECLARLAERGVSGGLLATEPGAQGKKRALERGAAAARFPWVAVLDADSRPGPAWLAALAEAATPPRGLLAAPVVFLADTPFTRLARLEYAGLLGAGLASFALGGQVSRHQRPRPARSYPRRAGDPQSLFGIWPRTHG